MNSEQFNEELDAIYKRTRSGKLVRDERFAVLADLMAVYERTPTERQSSRISDICLYEEVTDSHPDKMSREEYPIMSETQRARRTSGVHRKKDGGGILEVPLEYAENVGTDGHDYRYPSRRKWTVKEGLHVDEQALSRNKERRRNYRKFISGKSPGVFSVNILTGEKTIYDEENHLNRL